VNAVAERRSIFDIVNQTGREDAIMLDRRVPTVSAAWKPVVPWREGVYTQNTIPLIGEFSSQTLPVQVDMLPSDGRRFLRCDRAGGCDRSRWTWGASLGIDNAERPPQDVHAGQLRRPTIEDFPLDMGSIARILLQCTGGTAPTPALHC
jgi:hypothetical protein